MYVLSLCFHTFHLPLCCVHVCGCDYVFLDVITTEIVKMRRSIRKKKPKRFKDLGSIRPSRATGKCITKKTHQDGRMGNNPTERAVRGWFCTHFLIHLVLYYMWSLQRL